MENNVKEKSEETKDLKDPKDQKETLKEEPKEELKDETSKDETSKDTDDPLNDPSLKKSQRKPGRPRKDINLTPMDIFGITPEASNEENIVELSYKNPSLFKKFFTSLYKNYAISNITFIFDTNSFKIVTKGGFSDHISIYNNISVNLIRHYYCKQRKEITIKREQLEKIFRQVDKSNYNIQFILKEMDHDSKCYFKIHGNEMEDEKYKQVELINPIQQLDNNEPDESKYPIQFTLPSKYFKNLIKDIENTGSRVFGIHKNNAAKEPLKFVYNESKENKLLCETPFLNDKKIKLVNTLDPNDIFVVNVSTKDIKPFANACLGEDVIIYADKNKRICFSSQIDRVSVICNNKQYEGSVCEVKIYIDVLAEMSN